MRGRTAKKANSRKALAEKILREALAACIEDDETDATVGSKGIAYQAVNSAGFGDLAAFFTPKADAEKWLDAAEKMFDAAEFTIDNSDGVSFPFRPSSDWEWSAESRMTVIEHTALYAMTAFFGILSKKLISALDETIRETDSLTYCALLSGLARTIEENSDLANAIAIGKVQVDPRPSLDAIVKENTEKRRAQLIDQLNRFPHVNIPTHAGRPGKQVEARLPDAIKRRGRKARILDVADDLGVHKRTLGKKVIDMGFENWKDAVSHYATG